MASDLSKPANRQREMVLVAQTIFLKAFKSAQTEIEYLIGAAPTDKARSDLTNANMHLMQAKSAFDAIEWPKEDYDGTM